MLNRKEKKWSKHGRSEISRENVGRLFPLPPSPLSGEQRENVNRRKQEHTQTDTRTAKICNGGIRGGGGIGSQKVYVTPDIRDRPLKAWHEPHTHAQRGSFSYAPTALFCYLSTHCRHGGSAPILNPHATTAFLRSATHTENKFGETERVPRPSFVVRLSAAIHQHQQTLIISGNAIRHRPGLQ